MDTITPEAYVELCVVDSAADALGEAFGAELGAQLSDARIIGAVMAFCRREGGSDVLQR